MNTLCSFLSLTAFVSGQQIFDPYIVCNSPMALPPPPPGRPAFANFLSLCSTVYGSPGRSMGCFCDHPYGSVQCIESLGDPYLWSVTTEIVDPESNRRTSILLYDLCFQVCTCSSAAKGRASRNETGRLQQSHPISPSEAAFENETAVDTSASSQHIAGQDSEHPLQNPYRADCGNSCSKPTDCPGSANGCTCRTQKETYTMGKGTLRFLAVCMTNLGGKREEDTPCPCNATYVSYACCQVESGIVWEDKKFKLGELAQDLD